MLRNRGKRAGVETLQLYLGLPYPAGTTAPPLQLKGFAKTALHLGREGARVGGGERPRGGGGRHLLPRRRGATGTLRGALVVVRSDVLVYR